MKIPKVAFDFLYDREKLSDYNMILCTFDDSSRETVSMGNNLVFHTIRPALSDRNFLVNCSYEEPLSTTFQICKNTCHHEKPVITSEEINAIVRWLGKKDTYHKFKIFQNGYEDIFFTGSFNNFQTIKIDGQIYGLEFTFVSDSPYGYLDTIALDFTTASSVGYDINNFSHETGHLYPAVFTCRCLTDGDLQILNSLDSEITEVKNCIKDEIITLDGQHKIIDSNVKTHAKLYNDFNYNFFKLINTYYETNNTITTSIPCEIHIEYNPIRKVGLG